MKHVVVIETVDGVGQINDQLQAIIIRVIEMALEDQNIVNFVQTRFNAQSAIAATHEMFYAPEWKGGL